MGRRSTHTPEQLRGLVIRAAHDIIAEDGLAGLSAREIARRVGYSPGTLYNLFDSLDDLVLQVEAMLLDSLDRRLAEVEAEGTADEPLSRLARAYLSVCREHPKLWNLIAEHAIPRGSEVPPWYSERLERLVARIESALARHIPPDRLDAQAIERSARVLWAGLHGLASLSTADKLSGITGDSVEVLVDDFVATYLAGLRGKVRIGRI
ncbi:MAG: TetR/AcrR family transcriptional regulator [Hyphomicrobiaceae bacterium]|nr:TetR/AcrR family transcriptional regulator [Hyphomicrobiaceae bacterium]